ncbi:MAG: outer membrane protein assembly factor [Gemmatimonadetes bacterium]|nr:outer membrane protein assembly factor [Gemmatimonadota bacterium]
MRLRTFAAIAAGLAAFAAPPPSAAQDTTVAAGAHYRAGGLVRVFNGDAYRAEWTTPIRVPILDPATFAGGLTVERAGGGLATESLRMRGADGREYVFRSTDKTARRGLPEDLHGTFVEAIVQDLVSAKHPGAAHLMPPLLQAVGVLHVVPRTYVMPDHPFLGEFRERFAGRLGEVEERPEDAEEDEDEPGRPRPARGFANADRVVGTERLLERLEEDPDERVDSREYLAARLVDLIVGDWDRHLDQWRWAGYRRGDAWTWRPIPRDRDNAFSDYEGLVPAAARAIRPQLTRFGPRWRDLPGLIYLPAPLDRRLLAELDRAAWDSVTASVRARITDAVIARAVASLPAEYQPIGGARLAEAMRHRRDRLEEASRWFYGQLASDVDVRATDADERAEVERLPDGSVDVRLFASADARAPYFRRRFVPGETREVRVYLHGGADRATVTGTAPRSIQVRLIGGGGDDELVDRSAAGGGRMTVFHDHRGDNRFDPGGEARVDTRAYDPAPRRVPWGNPPPSRDWGSDFAPLAPSAGWVSNVGPVIGVGPVWTRYGFRRQPYARQTTLSVLYAPLEDGIGVEGTADFKRTGTGGGLRLAAGARTFQLTRFHGFGNQSPGEIEEVFEVTSNEVRAEALWYGPLGRRAWYRVGPVARWLDPREPAFTGLDFEPRGSEGWVGAGALAELRVDGRDTLAVTRRGWWLGARAQGYGSDLGPFGSVAGEARTYLSLGVGPILALRAGGEVAGGEFPFHEAAFLGGGGSLRGYPFQRFAGDAAAFGSAELRQPLGQVKLLVRGRLGVFALADAGRVWMDGDSPGGWHTDVGGGVWLETLGYAATFTLARGDVTRWYVGLGLPF